MNLTCAIQDLNMLTPLNLLRTAYRFTSPFGLFVLFLFPFSIWAQQPLQLEVANQTYKLGKYCEYWEDPSAESSLFDAMEADRAGKFVKSKEDLLFFGINHSSYWIKLQVQRTATQEEDWVMVVDFPAIDSLDFYQVLSHGKVEKTGMGYLVPQDQKPEDFNAFALPISLESHRPQTFFIRVKSRKSKLVPISIMSNKEFQRLRGFRDMGYGIFAGIFLIMFIYNLFIYFSLRDKSYLYYTFVTLIIMMLYMSQSGYAPHYLWPNHAWVNQYILIWLSCLMAISGALFTQSFLQTRECVPKIHWGLNVIIILSAISIVGAVFQTFAFGMGMYYVLFLETILLLAAGIIAWRQGQAGANYYTIAWGGYIFSALVMLFRNLGIIPAITIVNHSAEIGAVWQVVMLALALSDRYAQMRKEREEAIQARLASEEAAKRELEGKVAERTVELQESNEELNMMVEELNSTNERLSESLLEVSKKNKNIMSSIGYAQRIQQALLPRKEELKRAFPEHFVLFKPRDVVSGDFYWFDVVKDKAILIVADCTGHGVPGAFMSLLGNDAISSVVLRLGVTSPDEILTYIDREIYHKLQQDKSQNQDGMDMSAITYNLKTDEVEYAGAKRPLLMVKNGEYELIKGSKYSIGGKMPKKGEKLFEKTVFCIEEETNLYLFSDGYHDQFGGDRNTKLTTKRFYQKVVATSHYAMEQQGKELDGFIREWQAHHRQIDDILVCGLRLYPI